MLPEKTVYVLNKDEYFEFYTTDGYLIIKSVVNKSGDEISDKIFIERFLKNNPQLIEIEEIQEENRSPEEAHNIPNLSVLEDKEIDPNAEVIEDAL